MRGQRRPIGAWLGVALVCSVPPLPAAAQLPDARAVEERIEALARPDEDVVEARRPAVWLASHLDQAYLALLAALDHPSPEVAKAVLGILDRAPARPALLAALLRLATDVEHPLSTEATYALCRFGDDARVRPILAQALASPTEFADAARRACFAEALGERKRAVALLEPFLRSQQEREVVATIERLAAIGHPAALPALLRSTRDRRWQVVRAARLALVRLAPRQHALSPGVRQLLDLATGGPGQLASERRQRLAALPRAQVRPWVLAMLRTDARSDALAILTLWNDRAALPNLKALLDPRGGPGSDEVVRAYLSVAGSASTAHGRASADEIVRLAAKCTDEFACVAVARGVAEAASEHRAYVLGRMHERIGRRWPDVLPRGLRHAQADLEPLLGPLLLREDDPRAIGLYAELIARAPSAQHAPAVRHALAVLRGKGAADQLGNAAVSARSVVGASIALGLSDAEVAAELEPLRTAPDRQLRRQAACAAALQPGGETALGQLLRELGGERSAWAAQCLRKLPCRTQAERDGREATVLALLGSPAEAHALRVLVGCDGPRTTSALLPVLDGPSVERAVHAAWVLAQGPDRHAAERALRRLALHAVLHHGDATELTARFAVAPELWFEQSWAVPGRSPSEPGVAVPLAQLPPRGLDPQELDFLVRDYRNRVLDPSFQLFFPSAWQETLASRADASWAPFFELVATTDPRLTTVPARGGAVAHFSQRQRAAELLVRLIGRPARYLGLRGETLDSGALPSAPYVDQARLVACTVLDRLTTRDSKQPALTPHASRLRAEYDAWIADLARADQLGPQLETELLAEAERRRLTATLRAAGLRLWTRP